MGDVHPDDCRDGRGQRDTSALVESAGRDAGGDHHPEGEPRHRGRPRNPVEGAGGEDHPIVHGQGDRPGVDLVEAGGCGSYDRWILRAHPVGAVVVPDSGPAVGDLLPARRRLVVPATVVPGVAGRGRTLRSVPTAVEIRGGRQRVLPDAGGIHPQIGLVVVPLDDDRVVAGDGQLHPAAVFHGHEADIVHRGVHAGHGRVEVRGRGTTDGMRLRGPGREDEPADQGTEEHERAPEHAG